MPNDEEVGGDRTDESWLLQPLAPDEVRIHVSVGDDVELSAEFRAALDALLAELHEDEVAGFGVPCPSLSACSKYSCELGKCVPLNNFPCFADMSCKVANFGRMG